MNKFFSTAAPNGLQLPVAIMIRPIPHTKSSNALNCTGVLIGTHNADIDPILEELPNRVNKDSASHGERVVQHTLEFKLDQDYFQFWQSTHSTIKTTNPQLACHSTQVFFLFGNSKDYADLNSTQQFLQQFSGAQTYLIDYSGDDPELKLTTVPFEESQFLASYTTTRYLFFSSFKTILKKLDKLSAPQNHEPQTSAESGCAIL